MFINEYKFNKAKIGYEKILEKKKKNLFLQLVAISCNYLQLLAITCNSGVAGLFVKD